ncbi:MAG: hypothetical protein ACP5I1_15865, partial [Candidatus Hinthialibacter sp.]
MTIHKPQSLCALCRMNRRNFLMAGCALGAGAASRMANPYGLHAEESPSKPKIRIIYSLHDVVQPGPDWPNVGFNFAPVMKNIESDLTRLCPGFTFVTSMAKGEEEAKAILEKDRTENIDGYIVYQLNCWNRVVQSVVPTGKPVLYVDFLYAGSGGFLVYTAGFLRREAPNFGFMATSKIEDVAQAVQCFEGVKKSGSPSEFAAAVEKVRVASTRPAGNLDCLSDPVKTLDPDECIQRLQASKILAVRDQESGPADPIFGIPMERVSFAEINAAWESADKDQSREVAERWRRNASEVIEVSDETLVTSAAMYLGMKDVMKKHNANAITINCLGGFYGGHIHAYPCLGFHELNNEALVGGCECDTASTATMLMINVITQG